MKGMAGESGKSNQVLRKLLASQRLCVLATQGEGQPYSALVAFAETDDLRHMLFATFRGTRKYANLCADPRVALLIDSRSNQVSDFQDAVAVTVLGRAEEVHGDERTLLAERYLAKHPQLAEFIASQECALLRVDVSDHFIARFSEATAPRIAP
jgi:nitroimidazol reductase NimA-like FMN-containing flavoprotein (pyridoxamine 5'-phosphate oxidase superfamily)